VIELSIPTTTGDRAFAGRYVASPKLGDLSEVVARRRARSDAALPT
jgi:hypothetical protein